MNTFDVLKSKKEKLKQLYCQLTELKRVYRYASSECQTLQSEIDTINQRLKVEEVKEPKKNLISRLFKRNVVKQDADLTEEERIYLEIKKCDLEEKLRTASIRRTKASLAYTTKTHEVNFLNQEIKNITTKEYTPTRAKRYN